MNPTIFKENTIEFTETDVLLHLLQFAPNKGNKEEQTKTLLESFGSLKNILEARTEQIENIPGINKKTAEYISTFLPAFKYYQHKLQENPEQILNTRQAESYCKSLLQGERIENFYVIALSARCNVIGKRKISIGTINQVDAYPRIVTETALNYNAHSVLLTHNHPGGTVCPSVQDIESTIQINKILKQLGILILDHIIVTNDFTYSMIQHGDIDYR